MSVKKSDKILKGNRTHPNKKLASKKTWSKIKCKGAWHISKFGSFNVEAPFLLRVIAKSRALIACKCEKRMTLF